MAFILEGNTGWHSYKRVIPNVIHTRGQSQMAFIHEDNPGWHSYKRAIPDGILSVSEESLSMII